MITPPNGVVLDMFAGSGTTGVAAAQCGFHYILIEAEQEYIDICRARLAHTHAGSPSHPSQSKPVHEKPASQRIAGWGKKVAQCPTHGNPVPSESSRDAYGLNCYTCGCDLVYTKANTTPAPHQRPVDTRPTLWEVPE